MLVPIVCFSLCTVISFIFFHVRRIGDAGAPLGVEELARLLCDYAPEPLRKSDGPLVFAVDHCFPIKGQVGHLNTPSLKSILVLEKRKLSLHPLCVVQARVVAHASCKSYPSISS